MKKFTLLLLSLASTIIMNPVNAAEHKGKILVLLSSENVMQLKDGKTEPTGYYLNEFGVPADRLLQAGYQLVLATPKGNAPSVDKKSINTQYFGNDANEMQRIEKVIQSIPGIKDTRSLKEVIKDGLEQYKAVFIPGGHAPLIDLANNPEVGIILKHFHATGKPTAAICHGPIALLSAQDEPEAYARSLLTQSPVAARNWIYQGYKMTIFSDPEEAVFESSLNGARLAYYPGQAMQKAGGQMEYATAWSPHIVIDRELITGQNPFSDKALADAIIKMLNP